jgi:valyl-tRNA synthetase
MDEKRSESVIKVFVDLYNKGLIYRGVRMVNWDPEAKTALSDEEVNYKDQQGKLYYVRYKISSQSPSEGGAEYIIIATTRPETILGDTAVCINPNDPKNAHLKGKKVIIPIADREVPIIEDEYVDIEFGTGCLKVTPAHDVNDYMLGEKYNLPVLDIFNDDGTLNHHGLHYEGKDRFEVRRLIVEELMEKGLIEKIEPYENKVGFSERTNVPIEPKLSMQWFLKMEDLAKPALDAVMDGTIQLIPHKFKNMYRHWMESIKDWCISRQLWWGHRIPAWYICASPSPSPAPSNSPKGGENSSPSGRLGGALVVAPTEEEARKIAIAQFPSLEGIKGGFSLRQDEDCLDTWFSSWLWPISVFDGINNPDNKDINYYYPTNDLVTAPEIIFFWVARMIISGYEYRREACFHNVYFTGIVRDKMGRKMSKSLGNSPDPIELMNKYGADGVRMGMLLTSPAGNDLPFDEALCEQGRNFNNKIWNAFRLVKGWEVNDSIEQPESSKIAVEWFQNILAMTVSELDNLFEKYRLSEALMSLYKLFWDEFSSWYLEIVKPVYQQPIDAKTYQATLDFFDSLLRLIHPFMPFITEELWQALEERNEGNSIMISNMPGKTEYDGVTIALFEEVKNVVANIRIIRLQKEIPNKEKLLLKISNKDKFLPATIDYESVISKMCNLFPFEFVNEKDATAASFLVGTTEYFIPLGKNNIDIEAERKKLNDELKYLEGFLKSVTAKLSNEKFVTNAKPEVVENERKKQADAESKIKLLQESIAALKQINN